MNINLDVLGNNVTTIDVARHLGMEMVEENGKTYGKCFNNHASKSKRSFVLSEERGYICWNCGAKGNYIELYKEIKGVEFKQAIEELASDLCPTAIDSSEPSLSQTMNSMYTEAQEMCFDMKEKIREGITKIIKARGFDELVINKYGIGYSSLSLQKMGDKLETIGLSKNDFYFSARRLTIPIKRYGEVIGFTMRKITDNDKFPKYYNITKTSYDKWLWNFNYKMKEVVICEGVFDAMTVQEFGYDAVATLGTSISKERIQNVLKKVKKVYLMFDPDNAGSLAVERFFLNNTLNIDVFVCVLPNKDPDNCTKEEIDKSIKESVEIKEYLIESKGSLQDKKRFLVDCKEKLDSLTSTYMEKEMVARIKKDQVKIFLERASFLHAFHELSYNGKRIFTGTWNECERYEYEYKKKHTEIKDYSLFSRIKSAQDRLDIIENKILSAVENLLNKKIDKSSEIEINNRNEGV